MPVSKHVPLSELFDLARDELDRSINKPNILNYVPYPEQERFHRSSAFGRYISGANRGGKTDSVVVEAIWWATGTHPYLNRPESWGKGPLQLRFIVVDVSKGVEQIILPKLKRWTSSSMLIDGNWDKSWDSKNLIFTFANGSTIDFLTHQMTLDKHGGVPRHIIFYDEIPPQSVFNENLMRLIDFEGFWVIAATSTEGMGWTYDLLWEPAVEGTIPSTEIGTFTMTQDMNPYLAGTAESRGRYFVGMDDEERRIRRDGEFVAKSGLVFPNFDKSTHVVEPQIPPKDWAWYSSADFGWNNPTAWLWHAVSPNGDIITFAEHYKDHTTTPDHAATVLMREAAWQRTPDIRVGDPAGNQTQGNTGTSTIMEYALNGVYINTEGIPHAVMIGIEKMQQYFQLRPETGWGSHRPKWVITSNCTNFIRELKRLRWATYESSKMAYDRNRQEVVHKKDDHAFDSARYFATMMPDLAPSELADSDRVPVTISYVEMMARLAADDNVQFVGAEAPVKIEWDTTTSYSDFYEGAY